MTEKYSQDMQVWEELVRQWRASGLSAAKWCEKYNYPYKVFCYRKSQLDPKPIKSTKSHSITATSFIELTGSDSGSELPEIELYVNDVIVFVSKNCPPELLKSTLQILRSI